MAKKNPCESKEQKVKELESESEKLERVGDCITIDEMGSPQSEIAYVCQLKTNQLNSAKTELEICKKKK